MYYNVALHRPLDFFTQLDLSNEVECFLTDDAIIIRPLRRHLGDHFSVEILREFAAAGYSEEKLVSQFEIERANIKGAV